MRRRSDGQSIVEMAFVLPVLLIVLFGIIEFGYLIFAYSTISQAARNGAETAAQLPPYQSWLDYKTTNPGIYGNDACVRGIMAAITSDATLFNGGVNNGARVQDWVTISYPNNKPGDDTRNLDDRGPIEVSISYPVSGITPLFQLLRLGDGSGTVNLRVTQRRSLENLGVDPSKPQGVACARDLDDWNRLNP